MTPGATGRYVRFRMATADELAGIDLFSSLDESDLQTLAPWFSEESKGEGMKLCGEGAGLLVLRAPEGSAVVTADGGRSPISAPATTSARSRCWTAAGAARR